MIFSLFKEKFISRPAVLAKSLGIIKNIVGFPGKIYFSRNILLVRVNNNQTVRGKTLSSELGNHGPCGGNQLRR